MPGTSTIRWGILATGGIAVTFTKDLLVDPTTRDVHDIKHTVVAAGSSSSKQRAEEFLKETGSPSDAKAYGTYEELVKDPNIDIIYVATPHSHHYQNARLALEAGKHVLCEKAFTTNAAQAKTLVEIAKKKGLFLMEAVWTRYFPLSHYVRETITGDTLGSLVRVLAENSIGLDLENLPDGHRMINPDLAGGALLDSGIYALTHVFMAAYSTQDPATRKRPTLVGSAMTKARTGVDESTVLTLNFPSASGQRDVLAVASTSIAIGSNPGGVGDRAGPAIRIQGTKGELQVFAPAYRPTKTKLITTEGKIDEKEWKQPGPGAGSKWFNGFGNSGNEEGEGHGMFWEADEAARAIVEGRQEGRLEGWDESILIMEIMDEARKVGGLKYPTKIETTDYPVTLSV